MACGGPPAGTCSIASTSAADRGDADSLDAAKAAFRARVEAVGAFDPATMRRRGAVSLLPQDD